MRRSIFTLNHRLARRAGLWWLVLALVLTPVLGGMHHVLHLPAHAGSSPVAEASAHGLGALFVGHHAADCQLLDQLIQGNAPATPWTAPTADVPPGCPPTASAQAPRPGAALPFQARAPPAA